MTYVPTAQNKENFRITYFTTTLQQYLLNQVVNKETQRPRNYKINYSTFFTNVASSFKITAPNTPMGFSIANFTASNIPKNIYIALVPENNGLLSSDGFGNITTLNIKASNMSSEVFFDDITELDTITNINGYRSVNPFIKSACGYPVLISTSQLNFTRDSLAGQQDPSVSIYLKGTFQSPLPAGTVFRLVVVLEIDGALVYNDGRFSTTRSEERRGGKEGRSRWSPDH